jgi:hypothetical protein
MRFGLTVALFLLACGGGDGGGGGSTPTAPTTPTPPTPVATSITLSATSLSLSYIGATQQLSATVKDQSGAPMSATEDAGGTAISGATVTWASSDTTIATVSSAGLVTAVSNGTDTITATSGSARATAEVTVNLAAAPTLDAITVNWTEGAAATITGTGFSATASSNTITVDGLTASITSASITELQITVPTSACKPSRVVDLVVTVANVSESATTTVGVKPGKTIWDLDVGGGVYTVGGDCLHLAAGSGSEKYIIGIMSSSEAVTSLTAFTQTAIAGTTLAASLAADDAPDVPVAGEDVGYFEAPIIAAGDLPAAAPAPSQKVFRDPEYEAQMLAHAEAEARRWENVRQTKDDLALRGAELAAMAPGLRASSPWRGLSTVGDTMTLKVHTSGSICSGTFEAINTVVRYIGTSAIYIEDTANPLTKSFTTAEYAGWDATLSGTTLPVITNYFGEFVDTIPYGGVVGDTLGLDADGRIGVIITKEVNKQDDVLGFVNPYDLTATSYCPGSNQAEVFYGITPDPAGVHGEVRTKESVSDLMPALIAHEVTHIAQEVQYFFSDAAIKASWESEGGATLAEQLVGNAVLGHGGSGQNLGVPEFDEGYFGDGWYKDWAHDLRRYFGNSSSGKVENAPEQCSWLGKEADGNTGPCSNGRAVYGVPATLLRFLLDYYGPYYSGGEAALMRDLTNSDYTGYDNLVTTTDASSFGYILTLFGASLYLDGRHTGIHERVWLTSWDLTPIIASWPDPNYGTLTPYTSSDAEPTTTKSVRGGSTAYLEWEPPSSHAPTSFRIRTPEGDKLPDEMGMWIFRIQ